MGSAWRGPGAARGVTQHRTLLKINNPASGVWQASNAVRCVLAKYCRLRLPQESKHQTSTLGEKKKNPKTTIDTCH
ncbi:hypothetical protein EVAR_54190_1 [Eumeta japonica]|uniref:Uncharacterized protein n=1 Tax=Eumeta variegata TaxID=151549 RepID=A0A4C1ZEK6_EUMVA|nr:hypothetical protein EVAR_54190_1 [Eumeta japonica]